MGASLLDQLGLVQSRRSLLRFYQLRHPTHLVAKHHILFADRLERIAQGHLKTLAISAPPGSAKSTWSSIEFPSWLFGHRSRNVNDEVKMIVLANTGDLADDFGEQTKEAVISPLYQKIFPHLTMSQTSKSKSKFTLKDTRTPEKHRYVSRGYKGPVTGKRADLLILDDLVKGPDDVRTQRARDKTFDQVTTVGLNRLKGLEATVALQTRWHIDDTIGRIVLAEKDEPDFEYINVPAIANNTVEYEIYNPEYRRLMRYLYGNENYIQNSDECIWENHPTRLFRRERLDKLARYYGSARFAALYQGQPYTQGGGNIKVRWFRFYHELPPIRYYIITADTAWTDNEDSSYTVFQLWGRAQSGEAVLVDQLRGRWTYDVLKIHAEKFIRRCQHNVVKEIIIEEKASGHALIAEWANKYAIPVKPFKTGRLSKETRTELVIPYIESGYVLLPHKTAQPWVQDFVDENEQYPNGTRDQIDAMVIGLNTICVTGINDYAWVNNG